MKKFAALILALVLSLTAVSALADTLIIGIPDDGTNLSRAIKLLEVAGLIEVDPAVGYTPEIKDITKYIYDIEISPVAANTLTSTLVDYAAATINGTYAIPFGLIPSENGLIIEKQSESGDNPYVNIIAARAADADNETYKAIVAAYQTQYVAEFLLANYKEAFFPAFDYNPDFTVEDGWTDSVIAYQSSKEGKTVVRVGVCGANNDQWKAVQQVLDIQEAGIYIELVEFDAYNLPNEALNRGDIELNAFQHKAYLNNDSAKNGYNLAVIGDTLIAPLTLYSKNFDSIDAIKEAAGLLK